MPVDLTAIRALLASVAGFTEGPWEIADTPDGPRRFRLDEMYAEMGHVGPATVYGKDGDLVADDPDARLIAAAPDLHRDLTEAVGEIERLRAHNARMAHRLTAIADACAYADETGDRGSIWEAVSNVVAVGTGKSLRHVEEVLRRLAAGEASDA